MPRRTRRWRDRGRTGSSFPRRAIPAPRSAAKPPCANSARTPSRLPAALSKVSPLRQKAASFGLASSGFAPSGLPSFWSRTSSMPVGEGLEQVERHLFRRVVVGIVGSRDRGRPSRKAEPSRHPSTTDLGDAIDSSWRRSARSCSESAAVQLRQWLLTVHALPWEALGAVAIKQIFERGQPLERHALAGKLIGLGDRRVVAWRATSWICRKPRPFGSGQKNRRSKRWSAMTGPKRTISTLLQAATVARECVLGVFEGSGRRLSAERRRLCH